MRYTSVEETRIKFPPLTPDPEDGSELDHVAVQLVDWKARPNEVLDAVDKQLRAFGLEVVDCNFDGDAHMWYIEPYEPPPLYTAIRQATAEDALTKNQIRILAFIAQHPDHTADEIHEEVFKRNGGIHDRSNTVTSALAALVEKGIAEAKVVKPRQKSDLQPENPVV